MAPLTPHTPSDATNGQSPLSERPAWEQLDAYFAGELDAAAAEVVQKYVARNPEVESLFHRPGAFIPRSHDPARPIDLAAQWRTMESRMSAGRVTRAVPTSVTRRPSWQRWRAIPAIAAAATAAAVLVVGVWHWRAQHGANGPLVATEYQTRPGQRATVSLADGSSVLLGPASHLRVQSTGERVRDVTLDGEGYFTVHGQPDVPFVVHAGDGIVRVLGTAFSVRRYAEDSSVRVVVSTGRVGLRAQTDSDGVGVVLGASDAAQLGPRNRVVVMRGVDLTEYLSWRTGQLRFRNVPVSAILADLGREYDLDLSVSDSTLARTPITLTLHETTANGVFDVLSRLLNVDVQRHGRHVTLVSRATP